MKKENMQFTKQENENYYNFIGKKPSFKHNSWFFRNISKDNLNKIKRYHKTIKGELE